MSNAIITRQDVALGSYEEISRMAKRIKLMVKNGEKLTDNQAMALAQVATVTKLNPFIGEVWYIPGSGPMVGIAGARKLDNQQVTEKGGYTWEDYISVSPEEAGATKDQVKNVAAAFRVEINDSVATAKYQTLFVETLKALREAGEKDPVGLAREICGPRPVWKGWGFALDGEASKMSKPQLARKRAHADGLKRRVIVPFGAEIAESDVAPAYDVDAEAVEMEYSEPQETNQNAQVQEDERPLEEQLRDQVLYMKQAATPGQKSALVQHLDVITNNNRALLGNYLFGKPSSKDWTDAEIMVVWRYLRVAKDEDTSEFIPHPEAVKELKAMLKRAETEDGQLKMNLN